MSKKSISERVCVDTQTIIWGIQGQSREDQKNMIPRARLLFKNIADEGYELVIPSIVISELLVGVKADNKRVEVVSFLENNFEILSYDLHCAKIHGDLVARLLSLPAHEHNAILIASGCEKTTNAMISNDRKIVATAIANDVTRIYSHDKNLRNNTASMIVVSDLPTLEGQAVLSFDPDEYVVAKNA